MSNQDDRWLWFIDDAPLQALLKAEGELGTMRMRAASSPGLVRAMTAHLEGRTAEAAQGLREAIEGGEGQPEVYLLLGQIHFEAREYEEALAAYLRLLDVDPLHGAGAFNAGVCQQRLSRWNEAAELFRRSAKAEPERRESWLGLGLSSLHQRRAEEALQAFDRYLESLPNDEPALFGRAVALQMLRRFDEAAAIYERFRPEGEPSSELLTNLLALAVAKKDSAELTRLASELARVRPGVRQSIEAQAYASLIAQDWEPAAGLLAELSASGPLPEDWAYARAYTVWRCGRGEEALGLLAALLRERPAHPAALLLRGALLEESGRREEALTAYRHAAAQSRDAEAAATHAARIAAAVGNAAACRQAADLLRERNPQSAETWFACGLAAMLDRRMEEAVRAFSEALRLRPNWPEAEWNLGLSLLATAEPARAERALQNAFGSLDGQVAVRPLARAALENGNPARALAVLESAGEMESDPDLLFNIAVAFHESAKLPLAEKLYRRLIELDPPFADAHINLGHILLAGGRPGEAEELWSQAAQQEAA